MSEIMCPDCKVPLELINEVLLDSHNNECVYSFLKCPLCFMEITDEDYDDEIGSY